MNIRIREDLMDDQNVASIWLDLSRRGAKKLTIGCTYREHKLLLQEDRHTTGSDRQQWMTACQGSDVVIIGDTNLDHLKWELPERHLVNMVNTVKNNIEVLGFAQIVTGITRSWPGQASSLLDQVWTNCGTRIVSCRNIVHGASDHNLVELTLRTKGSHKSPREVIKRQRQNFDPESYKRRASEIDWTDVLSTNNLDLQPI